jgi:hypothetical protein
VKSVFLSQLRAVSVVTVFLAGDVFKSDLAAIVVSDF